MKIKASIPSFKECELRISKNAKTSKLKNGICKKFGIEKELTKLLFNGKVLNEEKKVGELLSESDQIIVDYIWARQLILWGIEGQKEIRNSTIFIAGAGALGNEVVKNLAMLGIRRLIIVDNDVVELSNTNRMIFFDKEDVGKSKAKVLAKKINKKFPFVEVWAADKTLEDVPVGYYLKSNLIISCLDNLLTRMHLTIISRKYSIPIVDGGISGYQARVQTYLPPNDPCFICPFSIENYGQFIGLRNACDGPIEEVKIPSFPTTISLTSSLQSQEAMKLLLGYKNYKEKGVWPKKTGKPLKGVWVADLDHNKYSIIDLKKNSGCFICGKNGLVKEPIPIHEFRIKELKDSSKKLFERIKIISGRKIDKISFVDSFGELKEIKSERKLSDYQLDKGERLHAIFEQEEDYKEMIIKII